MLRTANNFVEKLSTKKRIFLSALALITASGLAGCTKKEANQKAKEAQPPASASRVNSYYTCTPDNANKIWPEWNAGTRQKHISGFDFLQSFLTSGLGKQYISKIQALSSQSGIIQRELERDEQATNIRIIGIASGPNTGFLYYTAQLKRSGGYSQPFRVEIPANLYMQIAPSLDLGPSDFCVSGFESTGDLDEFRTHCSSQQCTTTRYTIPLYVVNGIQPCDIAGLESEDQSIKKHIQRLSTKLSDIYTYLVYINQKKSGKVSQVCDNMYGIYGPKIPFQKEKIDNNYYAIFYNTIYKNGLPIITMQSPLFQKQISATVAPLKYDSKYITYVTKTGLSKEALNNNHCSLGSLSSTYKYWPGISKFFRSAYIQNNAQTKQLIHLIDHGLNDTSVLLGVNNTGAKFCTLSKGKPKVKTVLFHSNDSLHLSSLTCKSAYNFYSKYRSSMYRYDYTQIEDNISLHKNHILEKYEAMPGLNYAGMMALMKERYHPAYRYKNLVEYPYFASQVCNNPKSKLMPSNGDKLLRNRLGILLSRASHLSINQLAHVDKTWNEDVSEADKCGAYVSSYPNSLSKNVETCLDSVSHEVLSRISQSNNMADQSRDYAKDVYKLFLLQKRLIKLLVKDNVIRPYELHAHLFYPQYENCISNSDNMVGYVSGVSVGQCHLANMRRGAAYLQGLAGYIGTQQVDTSSDTSPYPTQGLWHDSAELLSISNGKVALYSGNNYITGTPEWSGDRLTVSNGLCPDYTFDYHPTSHSFTVTSFDRKAVLGGDCYFSFSKGSTTGLVGVVLKPVNPIQSALINGH